MDFWHDQHPGADLAPTIEYSTNWYTRRAVALIQNFSAQLQTRREKSPGEKYAGNIWIHLPYQGVHAGARKDPPAWERLANTTSFWDAEYGSMLSVVDDGVGNITHALKNGGLWNETLLLLMSDNGAPGIGNNFPNRGMKRVCLYGGRDDLDVEWWRS